MKKTSSRSQRPSPGTSKGRRNRRQKGNTRTTYPSDRSAASCEKSRYGIPPILLFLSYSMMTNKKCGYDGKLSKRQAPPRACRGVYCGLGCQNGRKAMMDNSAKCMTAIWEITVTKPRPIFVKKTSRSVSNGRNRTV
jgi:hypothetical protein